MIAYDSSGRKYKIDDNKEIARGGEGRIVNLNGKFVSKIYLQGIQPLTKRKFSELSVLDRDEFIRPTRLLFDKPNGRIIGYTMKAVPPKAFPLYSAFNSNFIKRQGLNPKWKKEVAEKMIDSVSFVHSEKIVIGDLSGFNIMMENKGTVYFIDVDSYETPSEKHSGRMLNDIRDFLYGGQASKESDYFSLAVVLFHLFTGVHPFKGTHRQFKGIDERMIKKIPIFDKDPDLIVPKCYVPIIDKFLMEQFERIFKDGDRFLLSLKAGTVLNTFKYSKKISTYSDQLVVKNIYEGKEIRYVKCSDSFCCIVEKDKITILETRFKGYHRLYVDIGLAFGEVDDVIPTNENIFLFLNGSLHILSKDGKSMIPIDDFHVDNYLYTRQYENVYVVVTEEITYVFKLDKLTGNHVKYETVRIQGRSLKNYQGLVQNISGVSYIRYNKNGVLNTVKFPFPVRDIFQSGNVGMVQFTENDSIKYRMFNIDGLKVNISGEEQDKIKYISDKDNEYIVIPEDGAISFLRSMDFYPLARYESDNITDDSQVFVTGAGILVLNQDDKLYLINRK